MGRDAASAPDSDRSQVEPTGRTVDGEEDSSETGIGSMSGLPLAAA